MGIDFKGNSKEISVKSNEQIHWYFERYSKKKPTCFLNILKDIQRKNSKIELCLIIYWGWQSLARRSTAGWSLLKRHLRVVAKEWQPKHNNPKRRNSVRKSDNLNWVSRKVKISIVKVAYSPLFST